MPADIGLTDVVSGAGRILAYAARQKTRSADLGRAGLVWCTRPS